MTGPLVSVVIPSYNCGSYILEAIRSVAGQTYENFELIIVEDCSTDDSRKIICEHKEELASRIPGGFTF